MKQDIDFILEGWEYKPGMVQARLVQARRPAGHPDARRPGRLADRDAGRPDGTQPHGHATYFDYLREQARMAAQAEQPSS